VNACLPIRGRKFLEEAVVVIYFKTIGRLKRNDISRLSQTFPGKFQLEVSWFHQRKIFCYILNLRPLVSYPLIRV
jgi:hypothetical protein